MSNAAAPRARYLVGAFACSGAMALGAIGPWGRAPGYLLRIGGLDMRGGWIIGLAVVAAVLLARVSVSGSLGAASIVPFVGLAGVILGLIELRRLTNTVGITETANGIETEILLEPMWGLILVLISSAALIVAAVLLIREMRHTAAPADLRQLEEDQRLSPDLDGSDSAKSG